MLPAAHRTCASAVSSVASPRASARSNAASVRRMHGRSPPLAGAGRKRPVRARGRPLERIPSRFRPSLWSRTSPPNRHTQWRPPPAGTPRVPRACRLSPPAPLASPGVATFDKLAASAQLRQALRERFRLTALPGQQRARASPFRAPLTPQRPRAPLRDRPVRPHADWGGQQRVSVRHPGESARWLYTIARWVRIARLPGPARALRLAVLQPLPVDAINQSPRPNPSSSPWRLQCSCGRPDRPLPAQTKRAARVPPLKRDSKWPT